MFPKDGKRFDNVDHDGDDKEFDLEKVFGNGEEFDDISLDYYEI